jgi:hypothetical protein
MVLSVFILSLHAQCQLQPVSPQIAAALQMDVSAMQFDAPVSMVPRVPRLLYPHMVGARLMSFPKFQDRWRQFGRTAAKVGITATDAVRMAVYGWVPELCGTPYQRAPPPEPKWTTAELTAMTTIHAELIEEKIVEPIPDPDFSNPMVQLAAAMTMCYFGGTPFMVPQIVLPFVHVMFAVPKPHSDKWRGVSGLSSFNRKFMIPRHFKMEGLHTVRQLIRALDWLTVIDLKAAYPTMGINFRYRNWFIFRFRGKFYRYRGAVFGASSLPRAFTKLLRPVVAFLRSFGLRIVIFLDDLLIMSTCFAACAQDTQDVIMVLTHLGFIISTKEQVKLIPEQAQVWCGVRICSLTMQFTLPNDKLKKIRTKMKNVLKSCASGECLTLKQWASVLGTMRSTLVCVLPALLFSQGVRRFVNLYISPNKKCWDKVLPPPPLEVLDNLRRFASPDFNTYNGRPIRPLPADLLTDSDASGFGGGIVLQNSDPPRKARWHWLPEEEAKHINYKELITHLKGLQALDLETPGLVLNQTIFNRCDNSVSVSYVNRQGGRIPELSYAAEALWYWLLARGSQIKDIFLPGIANVDADTESRWFIDVREYQLLPALFRKLNQEWGPFSIDAFASRVNCQMRPFWSQYNDPDTAGRDALQQNWSCHNLYLFPPYALIPRTLSLLGDWHVTSATIVVPLWPTQPWWPLILSMTLAVEVLGFVSEVTQHPTRRMPMQHAPTWKMAAFRLSGKCCNSRDIMKLLSDELWAGMK